MNRVPRNVKLMGEKAFLLWLERAKPGEKVTYATTSTVDISEITGNPGDRLPIANLAWKSYEAKLVDLVRRKVGTTGSKLAIFDYMAIRK